MTTLAHEGFQQGQTIRAFDHEPRPGVGVRYAEGRIIAVNRAGTDEAPFAHYLVEVERDTTFPENPRPRVLVPMEVTFTEWPGRVQLRGSTIEGRLRSFSIELRDGTRLAATATSERQAVDMISDYLLDAGEDTDADRPVAVHDTANERRGHRPTLAQAAQAGRFDASIGAIGELLDGCDEPTLAVQVSYWSAFEKRAAELDKSATRQIARKRLGNLRQAAAAI